MILKEIFNQFFATSFLEWIAFGTSLIYVYLASKQRIACWFFAIISSSLYVKICYDYALFLDANLQVYYVLIAFVGWFKWKSPKLNFNITNWTIKTHLLWILSIEILALLLGYLFDNYTAQVFPFVDANIFLFSIFATYLISIKKIENWLYFIVIDIVATYLFWTRGLLLTSILYLLYTIFAIYGYFQWKNNWKTKKT